MTTKEVTLASLPVEILHRIFNNLDAQTILLSLSCLCAQLRRSTQSYNRYDLDFSLISKRKFDLMCHHLRPENTISLALSDDKYTLSQQIGLFLSRFDIRRFIRLRSLELIQISASDLTITLPCITTSTLQSLSIEAPEYASSDTWELFPSVIALPNLRKLVLKIAPAGLDELSWPDQNMVEHLTIMACSHRQYCNILRQSPNLRTFELNSCWLDDIDATANGSLMTAPCLQLTSLTFQRLEISLYSLEWILLLTPSVNHLKVVKFGYWREPMFNGGRWEDLIRTKLPLLDRFEFFFSRGNCSGYSNVAQIESIVGPFRSPFWLEIKRWFVSSDYFPDVKRLTIYSIPVCTIDIDYQFESKKISFSTVIPNDIDEYESEDDLDA